MQTPSDLIVSKEMPQPRKGGVVSGIREAAESTGVSFPYLLAQAKQESGLNPQAANRKSSAAGLFQFTSGTWLSMVKRHGDDYGLGAEAAAIIKGPDGKLDVKDKALKKQILDLRKDPKLSALMAGELARDNAKSLEKRLGRPATASDLYLAHFLGAAGAARVIEGMAEEGGNSAEELLPTAASANPDMFRKADTVAGLYGAVQARFKKALSGDHAAMNRPALIASASDLPPRPVPRPERDAQAQAQAQAQAPAPAIPDTPTTRAVAAVAGATASQEPSGHIPPSQAFAQAIEPESPFFPARIPPAPTMATHPAKADSLSQATGNTQEKGA